MVKITLDTNTFPLEQALRALGGITADVAVTTVITRELERSDWHHESLTLRQLPETAVLDESRYGSAVYGGDADEACFERALVAITNGSFPKKGQRENLTDGQRRQMRDAMIFCTHVREERDIFVSDDEAAFGTEGSAQRLRTAALGKTKIMTLSEFEAFCRSSHGPRQSAAPPTIVRADDAGDSGNGRSR
jgi:hypothetical protein